LYGPTINKPNTIGFSTAIAGPDGTKVTVIKKQMIAIPQKSFLAIRVPPHIYDT
jgi:hypothetical protein